MSCILSARVISSAPCFPSRHSELLFSTGRAGHYGHLLMDIPADWSRLEIVVHNLSAVRLGRRASCESPIRTQEALHGRPTRRTELHAEIEELQRQQLDGNVRATYVGWTREEEAAHDKRAERIALLKIQLIFLKGNPR